ncbi:MAG: hypothetical protein SFX73_16705 [Kofleriaceae bacterium]|nr:hypothetical protein [Kofleriaceae bacterium]
MPVVDQSLHLRARYPELPGQHRIETAASVAHIDHESMFFSYVIAAGIVAVGVVVDHQIFDFT